MSEVQLAVQKGLLLNRSVVDPTELETLAIDDDRLIDIDLSVAKTPLMLLTDYMAVTLGPTIVAHEARQVVARHPALGDEYPPSPGVEATVTVGTKRGVAFDITRRRARQRASLEILKAAHPHLSLYKELLELYSPDSLSALQPEQFPVSLLPAQSAVAAELRAGDKFTSYSTQHLEKAEAKRQRTATVLASEADGGGGGGGAVDDGIPQTAPRVGAQNAEERRHLPGEGHNFATQWQRQWAVERARAEAGRTDNDTLFAFQIDQVAPRSRAEIARRDRAPRFARRGRAPSSRGRRARRRTRRSSARCARRSPSSNRPRPRERDRATPRPLRLCERLTDARAQTVTAARARAAQRLLSRSGSPGSADGVRTSTCRRWRQARGARRTDAVSIRADQSESRGGWPRARAMRRHVEPCPWQRHEQHDARDGRVNCASARIAHYYAI